MSSARVILHAFADEERPARALAAAVGVEFAPIDLHVFPDGELLPTVPATAPTTIVYRSLARPNEKLIALLLACDAWRRGGARRLVLVAPYLCYLRQDAIFAPGQPNSQTVLGELLGARFERIVTVDAHLHRTLRLSDVFPNAETDDLSAAPALAGWLGQAHPDIECIVGPDSESAKWVGEAAATIGLPYYLMKKQRRGDADVRLTLDDPQRIAGRAVALVDDICSSGGTLIGAAELLHGAGARKIVTCVTHALFEPAVERRLRGAGVSAVASTDGVIHPTNAVNLAPLLADALRTEVGP